MQNLNSPLIDASFLYGSDKETAEMVRQFQGGELRFQLDNRYKGSLCMLFT